MLLGIRWGSLRRKIIAWSFVPAALILLAVALLSVRAFQEAAEALVVQRDRELIRLYAVRVGARLSGHIDLLETVARSRGMSPGDPAATRAALRSAGERLALFDGGVVALRADGQVVASWPEDLGVVGQDWSARACVRRVLRDGAPAVSDVLPEGPWQTEVVAVAVPIAGDDGAPAGAVVGMFRFGAPDHTSLRDSIAPLFLAQDGDVYLVDGRGRVMFHSDPDQVGESLTARPPLLAALAGDAAAGRMRDPTGREVLVAHAPIPDTSWDLVSEVSWSAITAGSRRHGQLLLGLLILGVLVPAVVVTVGTRRITRSIQDLIEAARTVARGEFGRTIQVRTGDEIEDLAHQFNLMSTQLDTLYGHLEQRVADRTRELEQVTEAERRRAEQFRVISEVGRHMVSLLPLDELLSQIVEVIQLAFGYYHVGIALVEGDYVFYRAGAGALWSRPADGEQRPGFEFRPRYLKVGEEGITGWVAARGEPLIVPDVSKDPRYVEMEGSGTRSEVMVPITLGWEVIGVLDVQSDRLGAFDESDVAVLQSLANQAAIAIQNARLYDQARQVAVLEERQRVARDLHDSVTQSLYGVTLYADAAARLLVAGEVEQATDHVARLRDTAKEALREMRLLIFELRPPELQQVGLVAALGARLDAVEGRAGLRTELVADEAFRAPAPVEEALYRIAQEALNNTLKHAAATVVRLTIRHDERRMTLAIEDDGVGFDVAEARQTGGLGLRGMEERVASLGGRLRMESAPGQGTRVAVEVPL